MNKLIGSAVVLVTAGALAGCAQMPPAAASQHGSMMGGMPMMMGRGASGPEMDKMMAMCMEHMQAMSERRGGGKGPQSSVQ